MNLESTIKTILIENNLAKNRYVDFTIDSEQIVELMAILKSSIDLDFDLLESITAIDLEDGSFKVIYHLTSITKNYKLAVNTTFSTNSIQSVSGVYPTANWHEREAFDLFGILFENHPDLRRIFMPDDWEGNPMLKNYKTAETYHGVKIDYEDDSSSPQRKD
ncbi:MAG: NADH-quinone oxidoreductase subunit C [Sphingobacteriales bacterium]|jgi:NADH-quinone oxidoreductase subunit C